MRRALALTALAALTLTLGGCSGEPDAVDQDRASATDVPQAVAKSGGTLPSAVENQFGTPVKDRVATIGLLNKRNNLIQDMVMKSGESRRFGNVVVRVATCERTLPWEKPPETGAFVQVFVEERADASAQPAWRTVFSGWMFKNSPSLSVVEHPVYDVWVKDCAMKFPGEEEDAASASSAAKPAGSASAAPRPPASPSPSPSPSPLPSASPATAADPV